MPVAITKEKYPGNRPIDTREKNFFIMIYRIVVEAPREKVLAMLLTIIAGGKRKVDSTEATTVIKKKSYSKCCNSLIACLSKGAVFQERRLQQTSG